MNTLLIKLQQIDVHKTVTMGEQPIDPVAYNQCHTGKMAKMQYFLSRNVFRWFLKLHEIYNNGWSVFGSAFIEQFGSQKSA